jgi:hypothetical protein
VNCDALSARGTGKVTLLAACGVIITLLAPAARARSTTPRFPLELTNFTALYRATYTSNYNSNRATIFTKAASTDLYLFSTRRPRRFPSL